MTHVASRTRPSLFLRVTLKGGCGLGTRLAQPTTLHSEMERDVNFMSAFIGACLCSFIGLAVSMSFTQPLASKLIM